MAVFCLRHFMMDVISMSQWWNIAYYSKGKFHQLIDVFFVTSFVDVFNSGHVWCVPQNPARLIVRDLPSFFVNQVIKTWLVQTVPVLWHWTIWNMNFANWIRYYQPWPFFFIIFIRTFIFYVS